MTTTRAPRRTYTPEDFLKLGSRAKGYELVDGKLEALNMSVHSCYIAGNIQSIVCKYAKTHAPGWVFPAETGCRCFANNPNLIRKPDMAYVALNRLTGDQVRSDGFLEVVPDFVVEVISPGDRAYRVNDKLDEWRTAGVRLVWLVYPNQQAVFAYSANGNVNEFRVGDTITADPVLPGFAVPVAELFRLPA